MELLHTNFEKTVITTAEEVEFKLDLNRFMDLADTMHRKYINVTNTADVDRWTVEVVQERALLHETAQRENSPEESSEDIEAVDSTVEEV